MKIVILVLSSVVLASGAAFLSAHRLSESRVRAEAEEPAPADRGSGSPGLDRRVGAARAAQVQGTAALAVGDRSTSGAALPGADGQPGSGPPATDTTAPTAVEAGDGDEVAAPAPVAHPREAARINPTSGEQMWSAQDVIREGEEANQPLCGGQRCRAGQFCCGPLACGRCAYPMAGPHCPGTCPDQKSN